MCKYWIRLTIQYTCPCLFINSITDYFRSFLMLNHVFSMLKWPSKTWNRSSKDDEGGKYFLAITNLYHTHYIQIGRTVKLNSCCICYKKERKNIVGYFTPNEIYWIEKNPLIQKNVGLVLWLLLQVVCIDKKISSCFRLKKKYDSSVIHIRIPICYLYSQAIFAQERSSSCLITLR